jgi:hypothetical protein
MIGRHQLEDDGDFFQNWFQKMAQVTVHGPFLEVEKHEMRLGVSLILQDMLITWLCLHLSNMKQRVTTLRTSRMN